MFNESIELVYDYLNIIHDKVKMCTTAMFALAAFQISNRQNFFEFYFPFPFSVFSFRKDPTMWYSNKDDA